MYAAERSTPRSLLCVLFQLIFHCLHDARTRINWNESWRSAHDGYGGWMPSRRWLSDLFNALNTLANSLGISHWITWIYINSFESASTPPCVNLRPNINLTYFEWKTIESAAFVIHSIEPGRNSMQTFSGVQFGSLSIRRTSICFNAFNSSKLHAHQSWLWIAHWVSCSQKKSKIKFWVCNWSGCVVVVNIIQ